MTQAVDSDAAAATRAVHVNATRADGGVGEKGRRAEDDLRGVLSSARSVQTASVDPQRDAYVIFHAVVGTMTDHLVRQQKPSAQQTSSTSPRSASPDSESPMEREVLITGFGGQGIQLAAQTLRSRGRARRPRSLAVRRVRRLDARRQHRFHRRDR